MGFEIFDFSSATAEQNSMKLVRKQWFNVLCQVFVFRAYRKNKMASPASDWLKQFRLFLCNRLTKFAKTWQEARTQCPLLSFCFSGRSKKNQDGLPGLSFAETFFLQSQNGICRNLTGSKNSTPSNKVCVFRTDQKNKKAALASDWLWNFRLLLWNRWTEFNETCQEAMIQRPLPSFCFFGPIGKTRWPPRPLIGWSSFDFFSAIA